LTAVLGLMEVRTWRNAREIVTEMRTARLG